MFVEFFKATKSEPPQLSLTDHLGLVLVLALVFYLVFRFYQRPALARFFKGLQAVQLLTLYTWYGAIHTPLSECLPLYHCRIAMFVLLFLSDDWLYKEYFALLGIFGSVVALLYPVFDPFPWFHVTIFSFIFGHIALLGNSLLYLLKKDRLSLTFRRICEITVGLNFLILLVDLVTGGDYGFLRRPPLVGDLGLLLNFLLISGVFILGVSLVFRLFALFKVRTGQPCLE